MKKRFALWFAALVAVTPVLSAAAEFSQNTQYREEVLSVAPYRIKYVLTGQTAIEPNDFPALGLDGRATLALALAGKDVLVHSNGLYAGSPHLYLWSFQPLVNDDPTHPISAIYAPIGTGFALTFSQAGEQDYQLASEFIVELKSGFNYYPEQVRIQAVYQRGSSAPFIDVFQRQL